MSGRQVVDVVATFGLKPGDSVSIGSTERFGGEYVVTSITVNRVHLKRLPWWRRLLRWLRRHGLDLGAP